MHTRLKKSKDNRNRAAARTICREKHELGQDFKFVDNRPETANTLQLIKNHPTNKADSLHSSVAQYASGIVQLAPSYYWRRQNGGPWIYSEKMGHKAATKWHSDRGYTNGNGWQFSRGGRRNPPGQ